MSRTMGGVPAQGQNRWARALGTELRRNSHHRWADATLISPNIPMRNFFFTHSLQPPIFR